jgi:hypothetical protein
MRGGEEEAVEGVEEPRERWKNETERERYNRGEERVYGWWQLAEMTIFFARLGFC